MTMLRLDSAASRASAAGVGVEAAAGQFHHRPPAGLAHQRQFGQRRRFAAEAQVARHLALAAVVDGEAVAERDLRPLVRVGAHDRRADVPDQMFMHQRGPSSAGSITPSTVWARPRRSSRDSRVMRKSPDGRWRPVSGKAVWACWGATPRSDPGIGCQAPAPGRQEHWTRPAWPSMPRPPGVPPARRCPLT